MTRVERLLGELFRHVDALAQMTGGQQMAKTAKKGDIVMTRARLRELQLKAGKAGLEPLEVRELLNEVQRVQGPPKKARR